MVFFVCFSCGESLKKNQVEKHWLTRCRHTQRISCMDCSKDFWGKEYAEHVKCITENEKYGGSQYVSKEMKGEKKQEAWIAQIKEKVANTHDMEPKLKELLNYITTFSNIPRKKEKFKNFLSNSAKVRNPSLVDKAWEVFQAASTKNTNDNNDNNKNNGEKQNDGLKAVFEPHDAIAQEQDDSQKSSLSKREKKEERQKKSKKKEKKDKIGESTTELTKPSKRKCEEDEIDVEGKDSLKKKKKPKHEHTEMECEEQNDRKSKKKKKRFHKDQNGALIMNENHTENMNSKAYDKPGVDVVQQPEEGKSKKKKKSHKDQNGVLVMNENHSESMNGKDHDRPEVDIAQQPKEGKNKKKKLIPKNENGVLEVNGNHLQDLNNGESVALVSSAFKWKTAIRRVLQDAPEEGMKISKLQRKVLSLYYAARGKSAHLKSAEEVNALLNKKLKTRDKFVVCKNRVKLRSI